MLHAVPKNLITRAEAIQVLHILLECSICLAEKLCLGMSAVIKLLHKQREQAMYWAKCSLIRCEVRMA